MLHTPSISKGFSKDFPYINHYPHDYGVPHYPIHRHHRRPARRPRKWPRPSAAAARRGWRAWCIQRHLAPARPVSQKKGHFSEWMIDGSLEVKLLTIWTDGKAEAGRAREEKSRRENVREEKEWEERRRRCAKRYERWQLGPHNGLSVFLDELCRQSLQQFLCPPPRRLKKLGHRSVQPLGIEPPVDFSGGGASNWESRQAAYRMGKQTLWKFCPLQVDRARPCFHLPLEKGHLQDSPFQDPLQSSQCFGWMAGSQRHGAQRCKEGEE